MLETSARLLRLLSLLQTRRDWSGADLADRLGVTDRTVRRDVDKLRSLGYPVHASTGTTGGYRLGAGAALPPLLLDDEEAVAVAIGLRSASGGTVAGIEETSVRALAKLEQVLPSRLRNRVNALQSAMLAIPGRGPTVDPDTLSTIASACRDHERLRFDYRHRDGENTLRQVEPLRLVHTGRRWYLVGFDVDRDDWRTFRVDRLTPRTPTGPRFTPREPPADDMAAYTAYGLSNAAYRYQAVVTLHMSMTDAAEHITSTAGILEPLDEHRCTLRAGSNSLDGLAIWVSLIGCDFEVHSPPELLDRITGVAERLGRAAHRSQPR
ncbi:helix-turn-helix transcriptional regulator [Actinokineospora diospyrosa]|uniref:DNA-binding transcriptional regulator YafY, contains an HTH and WYL domains n=1 Tax=Actinokineospora diospyrosa TaxID=103728 RepID=A0ABT1IE65_9PSEU|nr:YafY family protein [Actinokineospora diospyrosa]MCP2270926.1 putative DNA-binding transcriptional regulator YafY, contains an HTH and WYL domains [Actinokineospora diospyrosa]